MSKTKTRLQQAFSVFIFYLFSTKEFVLSFTVPQLFSAPAPLLCMGAQGESIREKLTTTIWEQLGLLLLVALPWDVGGSAVWMLVLLRQCAQIS